jgi:hypothetical protein
MKSESEYFSTLPDDKSYFEDKPDNDLYFKDKDDIPREQEYPPEVSRSNPMLLLFLIDQSESMKEPFGYNTLYKGEVKTKAEAVALALNNTLRALIISTVNDMSRPPRAYYDVGIIGYGDSVGSILPGTQTEKWLSIDKVADNCKIKIEEQFDDGEIIKKNTPCWIEPKAEGLTQMREAFEQARDIIQEWIKIKGEYQGYKFDHMNSYPPIIINITGGKWEPENQDPRSVAKEIMKICPNPQCQGLSCTILNYVISDLDEKIMFPSDSADLPNKWLKNLFEMSSELNPYMREMIQRMRNKTIPIGSRAFIMNREIYPLCHLFHQGYFSRLR